ncbi:hypothetical protein WA1_18105 [Scytonema hofmannii PCC 7110]|uniref:Uncharacterized protein n=1 Tax=Scytonema hofmannii PCC 7110 TaxID=128403 RepID=A0A139XB63_9CYAN|nr:hypothetical protein [Scytonema hofmannii]KYC41931.1 hypothetical protein WA1_18105 [Scytonema hofmannii PCC 7110]
MTQLSNNRTPRRGRVFPERRLSPEEIARRKVEGKAFVKRCRLVFDRIQPELIKNNYDWFIIIEPKNGDYIIAPNETVARQKAREQFGSKMRIMMRINLVADFPAGVLTLG